MPAFVVRPAAQDPRFTAFKAGAWPSPDPRPTNPPTRKV